MTIEELETEIKALTEKVRILNLRIDELESVDVRDVAQKETFRQEFEEEDTQNQLKFMRAMRG